MTAGPLTYQDAGVDIDAGNRLVERIKPLAAATARPGAFSGLGGFGGLFELPGAIAGRCWCRVRTGSAPNCAWRSSWDATTPSASTWWPCAPMTLSSPAHVPQSVRFLPAADLTPEGVAVIAEQVCVRVQWWFARSGLIEPDDVHEMLAWENSGFSLDARCASRRKIAPGWSGCCATVLG